MDSSMAGTATHQPNGAAANKAATRRVQTRRLEAALCPRCRPIARADGGREAVAADRAVEHEGRRELEDGLQPQKGRPRLTCSDGLTSARHADANTIVPVA